MKIQSPNITSGSITGSLFGTSSYAITSSNAITASYALNVPNNISLGSYFVVKIPFNGGQDFVSNTIIPTGTTVVSLDIFKTSLTTGILPLTFLISGSTTSSFLATQGDEFDNTGADVTVSFGPSIYSSSIVITSGMSGPLKSTWTSNGEGIGTAYLTCLKINE